MAAGQVVYSPSHVVLNPGAPGQGAPDPDAAPSAFALGVGIIDPRVPYNEVTSARVQAFFANSPVKTVGQVPSAISTTNIAAAQHAASGTPFTLVSSTGSGITVLAAAMLAYGSANTIPAGALAIDGVPTYRGFGSGFVSNYYSPAAGIQRGVSITAASGATGGAVLIKGADWFGEPMSQSVTAVAGTTVNSLKTFKFINSVTPQFTDNSHNYSVGTADVYGFGLLAGTFADTRVFWNNVLQLVAQYTAPDATIPATTATGDVRGTFTAPSGTPSNGTVRLDMFVYPTVAMMATVPLSTGMFGQPQV